MDKKKKNTVIVVFVSLILIVGICIIGLKFVQYELNQSQKIYDLQQQVSMLNEKVNSESKVIWLGGYNYLAIGNSITLHPIVNYWWAEDGMAATSPEKDYFHIVSSNLNEIYRANVVAYAYNYAVWETQAHDRAETFELLDEYLSSKIDLVTVQLSENCSDLMTFSSDFKDLLEHIKDKCGDDVQIIVIDDFWDADRGKIKKKVCDEIGISFVDLSDIRGDENYMAGMGTTVYGSDGTKHVIEHEGVAQHPGDKGMNLIAERVLKLIENP